jgi:hypothetical protein
MYYSYIEIKDVATRLSPTRTDLALKLLRRLPTSLKNTVGTNATPIANRKLGRVALGNWD